MAAYAERLVVRSQRRVDVVDVADVDWAEASGNYVRLHLGGDEIRIRSTFEGLVARLDPNRFLRIHRSIVINADRLRQISMWSRGEAMVILIDGTRLSLSRRHRSDVEQYLERLCG
jgi:two-component system LytT family response regulator